MRILITFAQGNNGLTKQKGISMSKAEKNVPAEGFLPTENSDERREMESFREEQEEERDESESYGEYAGSYAQDVEGWGDEMINDVFEGDPGLYWNID